MRKTWMERRLGLAHWLMVVCVLAVLPVVGFGAFAVYRQALLLQDDLAKDSKLRSQLAAHAISLELQAVRGLLQAMSEVSPARQPDFKAMHAQGQRIVQREPLLMSISVSGLEGARVFSTLYAFGLPWADVPGQSRQPLTSAGGSQVSHLLPGALRGERLVELGVPLYTGERLTHAIRGTIPVSAIERALNASPWPQGWVATVVDANHTMIARSRDSDKYLGRRLSAQAIEALQRREDNFETVSFDGHWVRLSAARIPDTQWVVAVGRPISALEQSVKEGVMQMVFQGLACLAFTLFIVALLARWMSKGIREAVSLHSQGDASAGRRIVVREVGELFERLTDVQDKYLSNQLELHAARRDPVTGLAGRSLFIEMAGQKVASVLRDEGQALALLFVDLDHFKSINDRLGHDMGDQVLRSASRALMFSVREADIVGRFGGDEFLICLDAPRQSIDHVSEQVADRVLAHVRQVGHGLGCSIGWALHRPGMTVGELIDVADRAMIQAKRAGKNRMVRADSPMPWQSQGLSQAQGEPPVPVACA